MELDKDGCQRLCSAVLVSAVDGYRAALERGSESRPGYEAFFRSPLCGLYLQIIGSSMTGPEIMETIKNQVKEGRKHDRQHI